MLDSFSINEALTCIITVANILMWLSMQRTIQVQTASNRSLNYQSLIQGHRDLVFGVMRHPEILKTFLKTNNFDSDQWALQIVSTFFINHAWVCYMNFEHGTLDQSYLDSFKKDTKDMFNWPSVYERWQTCKIFYPASFCQFVENELLTNVPKQPQGEND